MPPIKLSSLANDILGWLKNEVALELVNRCKELRKEAADIAIQRDLPRLDQLKQETEEEIREADRCGDEN